MQMTSLQQKLLDEQERNEKREKELYEIYTTNLTEITRKFERTVAALHKQLESERSRHLEALQKLESSLAAPLKPLEDQLTALQRSLRILSENSIESETRLRRELETLRAQLNGL